MDYTLDTIYLMDAFELLERLPDAAADLILTDPPYGIGYQNQFTQTPHPEIIGDGIKECDFDYEHMARECYRILKLNSHAYFFTRFDRYPLHYAALEQAGFTIKNCLVIEKNTVGGIGDLLGSYASNAEWVIFCQKGRRRFFKTRLLRNHRFGGIPRRKAEAGAGVQDPVPGLLVRTGISKVHLQYRLAPEDGLLSSNHEKRCLP